MDTDDPGTVGAMGPDAREPHDEPHGAPDEAPAAEVILGAPEPPAEPSPDAEPLPEPVVAEELAAAVEPIGPAAAETIEPEPIPVAADAAVEPAPPAQPITRRIHRPRSRLVTVLLAAGLAVGLLVAGVVAVVGFPWSRSRRGPEPGHAERAALRMEHRPWEEEREGRPRRPGDQSRPPFTNTGVSRTTW